MERYLAIDNVCAWPNLSRLPDGDILATIFNQPCHGLWEGDLECWSSSDDGRTWTYRGTPAPHAPSANRMNCAAGLARNGDMLVISSGWSNKPAAGEGATACDECEVLPAWVCRSSDAGRTWTQQERFPPPPGKPYIIPFGNIIELPNHQLGACGYCAHTGSAKKARAWFLRSDDDGESWGDHALIDEGLTEVDVMQLDGPRLLAAARCDQTVGSDQQALRLYRSDDAGQTWRYTQTATLPGQHPAHLCRLADNNILLTYGIRHRGFFGIGARLSLDDGETWMVPMVLVSFDDADDGGYPANVQLDDGRVLTVYYASRTATHRRYHVGSVIWDVQEQMHKNYR